MTRTLAFYFSFRSPYSYLAIGRLRALTERYDLDTALKIVRPLALREPDFFERRRPQLLPYLMRDFIREAERHDIFIAIPRPDPVIMDMESGKVDSAQPLMDMLIGLGLAACALGDGLSYAHNVANLIWQGTENWHEGDHLRLAAAKAGLEHDTLESWRDHNASAIASSIEENEAAQMLHHWGVPLMVLNGEPFFGQDRLETLEWRLQQG